MVQSTNVRAKAPKLFTINEDGVEEVPRGQSSRISTLNREIQRARDDNELGETLQDNRARRISAIEDANKSRSVKRTRLSSTSSI